MAGGSNKVMTDTRELLDDFREMIETAMDARQSKILTAMPVRVKEFDEKKLTVKLQPLVKNTIRKPDGSVEKKSFTEIHDVPVSYPAGGYEKQNTEGGGSSQTKQKKGYMLTFPLKSGDEGIGIISSRTIDHWHDKGEEEEQGSARMHNPSDMMFLPGVKSRPRAEEVEGGVDKDMAQLRAVNGKHHYGMEEDEDEGGLRNKTNAHIKSEAKKNIEDKAGETRVLTAKNIERTSESIEMASAGNAIVKKAPKIFLN